MKNNTVSSSTAIIGMDKNVGKTTVLNYLINKTEDSVILGLTSIGRDGESTDRVTYTPKPLVFIRKETLIATTKSCLMNSDITKEILESTNIRTPMGDIIIARSKSDGYIDLAGPSTTSQMKAIVDKLKIYGAEKIFVDGAISRMTQCSPAIVDTAILCTGANISGSLKTVVEKTSNTIRLLTLPKIDLPKSDDTDPDSFDDYNAVFYYTDEKKYLKCNTSLDIVNKISEFFDEDLKIIEIKGVFSSPLAEKIIAVKSKKHMLDIVIEDGTKAFIDHSVFESLLRNNIRLSVKNPIDLKGLFYNPCALSGYRFDETLFKHHLQESTGYEAINVLGGGCNKLS